MSVTALLCRFRGHSRQRNKVWHDGLDYRAPCARCGLPLLRDTNGNWRPFDLAKDAPEGAPLRAPRPSSGA